MLEKSIVINCYNSFKVNIDKKIDEISAIINLFPNIDFYFAMNDQNREYFKQRLSIFQNVKFLILDQTILPKGYKDLNKTINIDNKIFFNRDNDGMVVNHCDYIIDNIHNVTAKKVVENYITRNRESFFIVGETLTDYNRCNSTKKIIDILYTYISSLNRNCIDNLTIIYKPTFCYNDLNINVTNKHIDNIVEIIRSFFKINFNKDAKILYGANVNEDNVLSFCVNNNLDGFVFDWYDDNVDRILEFTRKVHGWQRILKNQLRRRLY